MNHLGDTLCPAVNIVAWRRYGTQLLALSPADGRGPPLAAYAGHHSVVLFCCQTRRVLRTMTLGFSK